MGAPEACDWWELAGCWVTVFTLKTHYGVKITGNLPLFAITDGDQQAFLRGVLYLTPITDLNLICIYMY